MKGKVELLPQIKISKAGKTYGVFTVRDSRGSVVKCLAFNDIASRLGTIDRSGMDIIVDGNESVDKATGEKVIYVDVFTCPEKTEATGGKGGGTKRPTTVSQGQPFKMWTDEKGLLWVRYLPEGHAEITQV